MSEIKLCPNCHVLPIVEQTTSGPFLTCPNCRWSAPAVTPGQSLTTDWALDFVANILYSHERPGAGVRWIHLREDLKAEYRAKARQTVGSFQQEQERFAEEATALSRRGQMKLVRLRDERPHVHTFVDDVCECGARDD